MSSHIKLRIKFSRHGALKFLGHLDIMRYFQKAFRRSGIDIAYTEGFSPHQIMSFAAPLGVGIESDGEYMDVALNAMESTEDVKVKLNEQMADGMEILLVTTLPEKSGSAMAAVAAAGYYIVFKKECEPVGGWQSAVDAFLSKDYIMVEKQTKKNTLEIDIRPGIYALKPSSYRGQDCLYMLVNASSAGNIKPTMVIETLFAECGLPFEASIVSVIREDTYLNKGTEEKPEFAPMSEGECE